MNKVKCLIVDDEPTARDIIETHLSTIQQIEIVASCSNAIEAFNSINQDTIDLIFLDINMPEISGISFAKSINKDIKIIFTTAYREYAIEGFDLHAVDYLLKPISFERLLQAVNNYFEVYHKVNIQQVKDTPPSNFIFVRSDRRMKKINFADILYVESYSDYLKIYCLSETIVTRENISIIEAKLPQRYFIRVHRSYIISLSHIESFSNEELVIQHKSIPISRSYKEEVIKYLLSIS